MSCWRESWVGEEVGLQSFQAWLKGRIKWKDEMTGQGACGYRSAIFCHEGTEGTYHLSQPS